MTETSAADPVTDSQTSATRPRVLALGRCRVGFSREPLPLIDGFSLLGHSFVGQIGARGADTLWARALHLEDSRHPQGGVTLVFVDLWSASLRLWLAAVDAAGVSPESLVLLGTHTHTGPGRFVGGSFYEFFGAKLQPGNMGYDAAWTAQLAGAIASAVRGARADALQDSVERILAVVRVPVWGASRNRSQPAFEETPECRSGDWWRPGFPGESVPDVLRNAPDPTARSIDPRLDVLVSLDHDGSPHSACGFFPCHATALGPGHKVYDRDWPGVAVDRCGEVQAAIGLSGAGDVTPLHPGNDEGQGQGEALRDEVGGKVSAGLCRAVEAAKDAFLAVAGLPPLSISAAAGLWRPDPDEEWDMGLPAMAGAEDGRSPLPHWIAAEGDRHRPTDYGDPQSPKIRILGHLQELVRDLFDLQLEPAHPWHRVHLGPHLLQTVPGEPTGVAAFRIGRRLCASTGAASATVAGYAGDYAGYFTTAEEYESQQYEGGSTLYGRDSLAALQAHLEQPPQLDLAALAEALPDDVAWLALEAEELEKARAAIEGAAGRAGRVAP